MIERQTQLIWGPWQREIREAFGAAQPILEKLPTKIDRLFLLYLIREQTWIALKYPNWEQRRIKEAWLMLCRAVETFLQTLSQEASKELEGDLRKRRAAVEATGVTISYWPKVGELKPSAELASALKIYSENLSLPSYGEALERKKGGRPSVFMSDAIAFAMKEHFTEKKVLSKWSMVSRLLKCAPSIERLLMRPTSIRQRLVRWQREEKAKQRFKPTIRQQAYEFSRLFAQWVKAGAKGPCPSLIQPSGFRNSAFDTSLAERTLTKIIKKLHKKYPPPRQ